MRPSIVERRHKHLCPYDFKFLGVLQGYVGLTAVFAGDLKLKCTMALCSWATSTVLAPTPGRVGAVPRLL